MRGALFLFNIMSGRVSWKKQREKSWMSRMEIYLN